MKLAELGSFSAGRTGTADLPLHYGKTPPWLFARMVRLARQVSLALAGEFGPEEMLRRLSDPFWFQALGCLLGFDWHSSGLTTTVCGALKEGIKGLERELGLFLAGGKGRISRQTPTEIEGWAALTGVDPVPLVYASRMAAKVDSAALQDGYQLYHHLFTFTAGGSWVVVQQGMNEATRYARRYHWLGERVTDFVCEPHSAICSERKGEALNLVAMESTPARGTIAQMAVEREPQKLVAELERLKSLRLPPRHHLTLEDIHPQRLAQSLHLAHQGQPRDFESLLGLAGVGAKTLRALSLLSELLYSTPPSFRDPARYSFAHGGKDGHPFPVDRGTYDRTIAVLERAVKQAKLGHREELEALRRLYRMGK